MHPTIQILTIDGRAITGLVLPLCQPAKFTTFVYTAKNHWITVIKPKDRPGEGTGAFAAGQAILDEDRAAVLAYKDSKGW